MITTKTIEAVINNAIKRYEDEYEKLQKGEIK